MNPNNTGPFKKSKAKEFRDLSIHGPWTGLFIALIAITQIPISLKATIDIFCLSSFKNQITEFEIICKKN